MQRKTIFLFYVAGLIEWKLLVVTHKKFFLVFQILCICTDLAKILYTKIKAFMSLCDVFGGRREGLRRLSMVDLVLSLLFVISCKLLLPPQYSEETKKGESENSDKHRRVATIIYNFGFIA